MEYFVIRFYGNSNSYRFFLEIEPKENHGESRWSSILYRARLEFAAALSCLKLCSIYLNFPILVI